MARRPFHNESVDLSRTDNSLFGQFFQRFISRAPRLDPSLDRLRNEPANFFTQPHGCRQNPFLLDHPRFRSSAVDCHADQIQSFHLNQISGTSVVSTINIKAKG